MSDEQLDRNLEIYLDNQRGIRQAELARKHKLTRERVRQIVNRMKQKVGRLERVAKGHSEV